MKKRERERALLENDDTDERKEEWVREGEERKRLEISSRQLTQMISLHNALFTWRFDE